MHKGEREEPNQTFSGLDTESYFEECASQYPLDPTAGFVLGISNLLFWAGIIIVIVAFDWIVYGWYILIERLQEEALGLSVERNDQE